MNLDKDLKPTMNVVPPAVLQNAGSHQPYHYLLLCRQYMGQYSELEMMDGEVYSGLLSSYDSENLYMAIPLNGKEAEASRVVFPFFAGELHPGVGLFGFPFHGIRRFRPYA
ncbi:hypothetical protein SAMN04488137_0209 [Fictibacillus solisalsi]|uniref:Uncharacterized protein n=1 Tax=Fictibacillus solisalsi TaxID=459525 RepID=A0A1G9TC93_9BACL|nr:hypothetical protein [Fictibacillus solisalsi]SDM45379.1 hypothetical protein SAMN04488137_0209 [Fictibacillus solisalsi]